MSVYADFGLLHVAVGVIRGDWRSDMLATVSRL